MHPQLMSTLLALLNLYKMYGSADIGAGASSKPAEATSGSSTPRETSVMAASRSLSQLSDSSNAAAAAAESMHARSFREGEKLAARILAIHDQYYVYNALDEIAKFYQHFARYQQCLEYRQRDLK